MRIEKARETVAKPDFPNFLKEETQND